MILHSQDFYFSFLGFEHSLALELFLVTATVALLIWVLLLQNQRTLGFFSFSNATKWSAILILLLSLFICFFCELPSSFWFSFSSSYLSDSLSLFGRFFTLISSLLFFVITLSFFKEFPEASNEFCCCILIAISSLIFLTGVSDFLSLFLCVELQGLTFYVLACFRRTSDYAIEAGVKYFISGAVASCFLLFGISLIYGVTGTLNFLELKLFCSNLSLFGGSYDVFTYSIGLQLGALFIIIAFLFKLGVAPFHFWVADVYEGSPTSVTAFFSLVPKVALFLLVHRLLFDTLLPLSFLWQPILLQCAVISVALGTLGALFQRRLKRLIAYSTIGHNGFLMLALSSTVDFGVQALFTYIIVYLFTTACIFLFVLNVRERGSTLENPTFYEAVGIIKVNPLLGLGFAIPLFSLAGIPPFIGFFAKYQMFLSSIQSGFILAPTITVFLSVLACFYYIRIIKVHFFDETSFFWNTAPSQTSSFLISALCGLLFLMTCSPKAFLFFF